jgi:hypothetical protein
LIEYTPSRTGRVTGGSDPLFFENDLQDFTITRSMKVDIESRFFVNEYDLPSNVDPEAPIVFGKAVWTIEYEVVRIYPEHILTPYLEWQTIRIYRIDLSVIPRGKLSEFEIRVHNGKMCEHGQVVYIKFTKGIEDVNAYDLDTMVSVIIYKQPRGNGNYQNCPGIIKGPSRQVVRSTIGKRNEFLEYADDTEGDPYRYFHMVTIGYNDVDADHNIVISMGFARGSNRITAGVTRYLSDIRVFPDGTTIFETLV